MFNMFKKNEPDLMEQFNREAKKREMKAKIKYNIQEGLNWVYNNREPLLMLSPIVITVLGGGTKVMSSMIRKAAVDKEQRLKDYRVYDRSLGMYHELKKPMNSKMALEFEERRREGQSVAEALEAMKLLK